MIENSQLQTLVAVARARSFSRAADELHVTQSAISQSIKNLENKLEVTLFKRSGKRVVLTQEGEKLFAVAQGYLTQLNDTLEEIKTSKDSMAGKIRLGTLTGLGKSWVGPEFLEFSKDFPELTVSLRYGFHEDLVKDFENYRLDVLVLPEESLPNVGEKILLAEEQLSLVFPKDFKITKNLSFDQLLDFPIIMFETEDTLFFKWCNQRFGKVPKKVNQRFIVNSHGTMLQAVHQGLGVAVVPQHVVHRSYYKDKVKTLGPDFLVSNGKFFAVYHKEALEHLRVQKTLERLKTAAKQFTKLE
jgi:DNA-binding transcriptional LysR family regulator